MANLTYRQATQEAPVSTTTKNTTLTSQEIDGNFKSLNDELITKAPLVSPGLSGVPTAPTATAGTNTTQLATTAFVQTSLSSRQPLDATLTALSGVSTAANQLIYSTASDTFSTTGITSFGRSIIDDADELTARTTLGLGTAAVQSDDRYAHRSNNLSDLANMNVARSNLGLSNSATIAATNLNTGNTIVQRDASGNFSAGTITASLSGNATTATTANTLTTARTISLIGDVTGSVSFNGSANANITATVVDDSHNHIISNVDGLQTALNMRVPIDSSTGAATIPSGSTAQRPTGVIGDLRFNTSLNRWEGYGQSGWDVVGGSTSFGVVDRFSGTGVQLSFNLSQNPGTESNTQVYINGIYQQKDTYSLSGTTITFSEPPPIGTDNIEVVSGVTLALGETDASLVTYNATTVEAQLDAVSAAYGSSLVGFQQAGTGAVARTAQDKLREFKSIADYLPVGYVSDGSVFYTAEIQKALDENRCLELPEGVFKHGRLVLKHQGQIIRGKGRGISVLYCPAGYGITNFSGADSDPVGADWVGNPTLEKLTLRGGFTHTDDFSPPANSWASATGRSKTFTTTGINAGLRLKRCYPYTLNEVNIEKFHRGVYVSAAALGRFNNFEISDCQYGMYGENGAVWGEAAWQVTTHRWSQGRFRNCWIGIGGSDYVQCQIDKKTVDFEPCNSGISVFNGGDNVWSGYFELCSEGIYRNGGDMGHDVIEDPFFAGSPGAFWGSGDSILLDSGIGPNGKVTLRHGLGKINGGGLRVLGGRLVQPEREKIGATVYLSPALTPAGGYTVTDISWAVVAASDDVLGLFSAGAPTRLTVPAALNGARVRLKSTLTIHGDATANDVLVEFNKNGTSFAGKGRFAGTFAYGKTVSFETAPITVATGDYFTVSVAMNLSRTLSTGDQCWLALEVLE